jgi:MATE family multidrug resistance protein
MIISSVTVPLLGIVDTAVMGHLAFSYYLGAVAVGATVFSGLVMGQNLQRMGTTGVTAQCYGARDYDRIRDGLGQSILIALVLAAVIVLIQQPLIKAALWLLAPSEIVARYTKDYFDVRVWSAPATLCNFVLIGWLLGMQNGRGPLVIMLTVNIVNITLDLVFVILLGMTVRGVALASVVAELTGVIAGIYFVRAELASHPGKLTLSGLRTLSRYKRLFHINLSLFLRTMSLMFVFAFITTQGARMGDLILAANAILLNFQWFLSYALDGIAFSAEALVGKAVGSRDEAGLLRAVRRTLHWSLVFATMFFAIYLVAGSHIIDLLTDIDTIRVTAREFLPWLIVSPLISVWSFLYDGVYVGATRSKEMMFVMAASAFLVFLPAWFGFEAWGNHGLWLAFTMFMAARGIGMHFWFRHMATSGKGYA